VGRSISGDSADVDPVTGQWRRRPTTGPTNRAGHESSHPRASLFKLAVAVRPRDRFSARASPFYRQFSEAGVFHHVNPANTVRCCFSDDPGSLKRGVVVCYFACSGPKWVLACYFGKQMMCEALTGKCDAKVYPTISIWKCGFVILRTAILRAAALPRGRFTSPSVRVRMTSMCCRLCTELVQRCVGSQSQSVASSRRGLLWRRGCHLII